MSHSSSPNSFLPRLILASASPRREQLLRQLRLQFTVAPQNIDESPRRDESAAAYVQRMAQEKGDSARSEGEADSVILSADTIVVCDQQMLGKPLHREDGLGMLGRLSGREHQVLSAIHVCLGQHHASALSVSRVWFREISTAEAGLYWDSGEPLGKAGAYAIQGRAAVFVKQLVGSYSGVMGLPLFETAGLLQDFGIASLANARGAEVHSEIARNNK